MTIYPTLEQRLENAKASAQFHENMFKASQAQLAAALSERDALKAKLVVNLRCALYALTEGDRYDKSQAIVDIGNALKQIEATGEAPVESEHASGMLTSKIETTGSRPVESEGSEK